MIAALGILVLSMGKLRPSNVAQIAQVHRHHLGPQKFSVGEFELRTIHDTATQKDVDMA